MIEEGQVWRQESVLGGVYDASIRRAGEAIIPSVRGQAWLTSESVLHFATDDPYRTGIHG